MSKWEKLLNRLLKLSNDLRFEELKRILEEFGYVMESPKGGGSHCTFRKAGKNPITIPRNRQIKTVYIRLVKDVVEKENENARKDN